MGFVTAPLYVSYYTPDYATRARTLVRSLNRFDLDYVVEPIAEQGTWQKDSQYKPRFIWDQMVKHFDKELGIGRPIVWIDADAEVKLRPSAFEHIEADVMACEFKNDGMNKIELLSGTVYFKNNVRSQRVVDAWIEECSANPTLWDQKCLRKAIDRFPDLKIGWLPVTYCFIFDTHRHLFPDAEPVILHWQESRAARTRKPTV